jgi:DNA polymerase-1
LKRVQNERTLAFRVTATSENPLEAQLTGITLSFSTHDAYYIPIGEALDLALVLEKLKPLLEDTTIQKVGHGVKYDLLVLAHAYRTIALPQKPDLRAQMQLFSSL